MGPRLEASTLQEDGIHEDAMNQTANKPESNAEVQQQTAKPKLKLNIVKATVLEPRIAPALAP